MESSKKYLEQFHHVITGPEIGRKWVFLHGLMGYANNWRTIIKSFESTERCLAYDQRGHGRSVKNLVGYSPEKYAEDLLQILNALQWEKIILVGHSMGGRNAVSFASQHPKRVIGLVVEDMGPESDPASIGYYQDLFASIPTPFNSRREAKEFLLGEFVRSAKTRDDPKMIAEYFYSNMEEKQNGSVDWRFSQKAILETVEGGHKVNRWREWAKLEVPTLLIRGENSKELDRDTFIRLGEENALIQCVEIADAGHWVHYDKPVEFTAIIRAFLNKLTTGE